jgi:hypothetical protein
VCSDLVRNAQAERHRAEPRHVEPVRTGASVNWWMVAP